MVLWTLPVKNAENRKAKKNREKKKPNLRNVSTTYKHMFPRNLITVLFFIVLQVSGIMSAHEPHSYQQDHAAHHEKDEKDHQARMRNHEAHYMVGNLPMSSFYPVQGSTSEFDFSEDEL